jgi:hypothetical protein
MKKLTKKRLRNEASLRELKGIMSGGAKNKKLDKASKPNTEKDDSSSSQSNSESQDDDDDVESEISDTSISDKKELLPDN